MAFLPVDVVLLAGGESRRFGRPKAAVTWRGRTLAEHVLAAVPGRGGRTVLVLREQGDPLPAVTDVVTHDDPAAPAGPLRGLVAGLRACTATFAWGLACDLPGVVPALLELLVDEIRPGDDAVIPVWNNRLQPLCALYRVGGVETLAAASRDGAHSLGRALASASVHEVQADVVRTVDPLGRSFHNINARADLTSFASLFSPNPESAS